MRNSFQDLLSQHLMCALYIHSEKDILKLVTTLIANTKGEGKSNDDFWQKAETLLYTALIGYIHYVAPPEEQNFAMLIDLISSMETREDVEDFQNPVDEMFERLEKDEPNHFAVRQYKKFKLAAGKTAKSILISCGARLAVFDIAELREVTDYDELQLDTLGDRKTALFLIMSDTDDSFNFLISMAYTQLFNLLCEKADDEYGGRLPVHVRCLIDEAANIGQIPRLEKLVATIRSREISACLEKLIETGLVERHGTGKTKHLLPTEVGYTLISLLPERLTSPLLTAEWEHRLMEIERGEADADTFMKDICRMLNDLVDSAEVNEDAKRLLTPEREVLGKCPGCGGEVEARSSGAFCRNNCGFQLWWDNPYLTKFCVKVTPELVKELLVNRSVYRTDLWSASKNKPFAARVIMETDSRNRPYFRMQFRD